MARPAVALLLLLLLAGTSSADEVSALEKVVEGRVDRIAEDQARLSIGTGIGLGTVVSVPRDFRFLLDDLERGDIIVVRLEEESDDLTGLVVKSVRVKPVYRLLAVLFSGAALLALGRLLIGRGFPGILLGIDGRYSKSKFQCALWFGAVLSAYIATLVLRIFHGGGVGPLGVEIPENLLLACGLSAVTLAAARGITGARAKKAGDDFKKAPAGGPNFPGDLLTDDDGTPQLTDFQMVFFTALAATAWLAGVYSFLGEVEMAVSITIPDIDTTLLAILGIGQGTYLAHKSLARQIGL